METTRTRFGSMLEWLLAAVTITAVVAGGTLLVRELRAVRPVTPVIAGEAPPPEEIPPEGIPARSVSVPLVVFADGKEVRIGDRASSVRELIGASAQVGADTVDASGPHERILRYCDYAGTRFVLVLERATATSDSQVAAIYLQ